MIMDIHHKIHDGDTAYERHQEVDGITELKIFLGVDTFLDEIEINPIRKQEQDHGKHDKTKRKPDVLESQKGKGHEAAHGKEHEDPASKRVNGGKVKNEKIDREQKKHGCQPVLLKPVQHHGDHGQHGYANVVGFTSRHTVIHIDKKVADSHHKSDDGQLAAQDRIPVIDPGGNKNVAS